MAWPVYKKELLALGNPKSSTGLCTLWTEKERVLKDVSPDHYLVAGQCYSHNEGISLIVRNTLADKRMHNLVLFGADLNNTGEALLALKENGVDEGGKIIGVEGSAIDKEVPGDAIERFRKNVNVINKMGTKDVGSLDELLRSLPQKQAWGEPETYDISIPKAPDAYPSEGTGFVVRGKTVGDTWLKILDTVLRFGHIKKSQHADDQQEITCLTSVITGEDPRNIAWKPFFQFTKGHLQEYLPQLMSSDVVGDVSYTYGSRLRDFKGINQIDSIVEQLKGALYSRRAVGVTWDVEKDHNNSHSPCLDLIQALAQDRMHMTAYLRSNDMFRAWPENAFALRSVQYEVAEKVGVEPGDLIVISNSAHLYSPSWAPAKEILKKNPVKLKRDPDPRGNILVELENDQIKVTHLNPQGLKIGGFHTDSAMKAYKTIAEQQMISQVGHALDIGVELEKAEMALASGAKYIQDKQLKL